MFYYIAKYAVWVYIHILYGLEVSGAQNIPKKGGILICANHGSNLDPVIVAVSVRRKTHYLGKKELFKTWFSSFWLKQMCVFPVDRGTVDMKAFRFAVDLLKDGKAVGIFAQGTRVKDGEEAKAKGGVSLFAIKGEALIVPIGITSSYKLFNKIKVNIGEPISLKEYEGQKLRTDKLNEISEAVMDRVSLLCAEKG